MIRELVENYEDNKNIVDNLNIHILPLANPDGYEYSRSTVSRYLLSEMSSIYKKIVLNLSTATAVALCFTKH